ncbi:MAG: sulfite exporter TauE/SafE family protein [Acidimicrobiia bacterium]|nr:sulfite exporter TauE/SafE family protein [Acidimicrobiia bacterium]MBP8182126.1 sulfite exporter TauE/SafE family protein [Acidimicrobiia bacterium]
MDFAVLFGSLLVGFGAGVLSGLMGVGGAVLTTPGIRFLGATPIAAVGSTVPAIIPGALAGAWRFAKAGLIDWRLAATCGISGSVFAFIGAYIADLVNAQWLMVMSAVLVGISGWRLLRSPESPPVDDAAYLGASNAGLIAVGAAGGFFAGLFGVGGGIVMIPLFTGPLRMPARVAVATSLAAVAIFAIPSLLGHLWLGHIDWEYAAPLMVGTVPGARLGSALTIGAEETLVRRRLAILLLIVAVIYGAREVADLLG